MHKNRAVSLCSRARFANAILGLLCACTPRASDSHPAVRSAHIECRVRSNGAEGLSPEWAPFDAFIDSCRVIASDSAVVLEIISVSTSRCYDTKPSGLSTDALPKPLILSED